MGLIHIGDCLEVMKSLDSGSIDAIVTDPPYGLSFMGKNWDHAVPGVPFWQEALRVAKPGCHILAAGGSRTYHRLAVAIEDAGWEIRDCVMWIYGSGFPKSHDVSKAIDREAGAEREAVGKSNRHGGGAKVFESQGGTGFATNGKPDITAPATEAAKQWQGWGTALKPAFEPFILARKPLDGTVAQNVQRHGCGGLNVDGCRVKKPSGDSSGWALSGSKATTNRSMSGPNYARLPKPDASGRWPANVIHDGSDEVLAGFPEVKSGGGFKGTQAKAKTFSGFTGNSPNSSTGGDSGSAARFFYGAKASRSEREAGLDGMEEMEFQSGCGGDMPTSDTGESRDRFKVKARNHHPTVKPVALMAYLCRLITPPNGTILDPFCGSGSTGVAAVREGFNFIGIELNPEYAEIATRRIENEKQKTALLK